MSENKKGPGSSLANSQGTNKSSNKLYHERNEESKMNISTAVSVLKNNLERYDEQKTVIPNELYRDGNIEHIKKGSAIGMADELINYIEFKDRYIFELDQKEIVGKLMIVDMRKGAKNE